MREAAVTVVPIRKGFARARAVVRAREDMMVVFVWERERWRRREEGCCSCGGLL